MDIDMVIDTINNSIEDETETEIETAKNQILGTSLRTVQRITIDKLENESKPEERAVDVYKKAIKEGKQIEFNRRLKYAKFKDSLRSGTEKVRGNKTLSNKPQKKR